MTCCTGTSSKKDVNCSRADPDSTGYFFVVHVNAPKQTCAINAGNKKLSDEKFVFCVFDLAQQRWEVCMRLVSRLRLFCLTLFVFV